MNSEGDPMRILIYFPGVEPDTAGLRAFPQSRAANPKITAPPHMVPLHPMSKMERNAFSDT